MTATEMLARMDIRELRERIGLERLRLAEHDRDDLRHGLLVQTIVGRTGGKIAPEKALPSVIPLASTTREPAETPQEKAERQMAALQALARRQSAARAAAA